MTRTRQVTLAVLAVVAIAFGLLAVLTGTNFIPGSGQPGLGVDSELRYYAAWYVMAGVVLARVARDPVGQLWLLRAVRGALALGATGRVIGWISMGRPPMTFVVLLIVEYAISAALLLWSRPTDRR